MFEVAGALAIVQPVLTLVGLVALPLAWAAIAFATAAAFAGSAGNGAPRKRAVAIVSSACAVVTVGLAIVVAAQLARLPRGHVLVQHVAQLARLGQLDLAFDLVLEPRSAVFALVVALVGCASALQTWWSSRSHDGLRYAWTGLVTAGAMLLCLGDGFAPLFVSLGLLSLGAWGLAGGGSPGQRAAALAGNVAVLLGFVFLFWSLGGAFRPEGYDPDGAPRFVLVATSSPSIAPEKATLAMTTHVGARVSADDAELSSEPLVAPFAIAVEPGIHTLRVHGGAASGDVVVPRVALVSGRTHVLAPYGPTASLRALDDQVAVPRLAPGGGEVTVRATLSGRTIDGLRASALVLLLVLGGALAHSFALAGRRGPSALASVLEALPAPYLALRLAPLVDPAGADGALVVVLGAGAAAVLAARAACVDDGHEALRGVVASASAAAVAAVGLGAAAASLVLTSAAIVAMSAGLAALAARRDARWLGVACAGAVGLLPGAGASPGFILAVMASLGSDTDTDGASARAKFALVAVVGLLGVCALGSLAAFRVYGAMLRAPVRDPASSRAQGALVIVLAVVALVGGAVLGVGTTMFGGHALPLAGRLAGMGAHPASRMTAAAAVVLSLLAAAGGALLGRRVCASNASPGWLLALGRPYAVFAWTADGVGRVTTYLQRSVRAMDRDVIDDLSAAAGELSSRAVATLTRLSRALAGRGEPPRDRAVGAAAVELDVGARRANERASSALLLLMVALLGFVVLSSFLLG